MLPLEASEVVRDLELKTIKRKDCTTHIFYERGTSATDRKRELREKWTPVRPLGNGAFGSVWLEQCDNMVRRDVPNVRAVKKIKISPSIDFTRELEAIAKFSHNRYLPCFVRCFGWFRIKNYIFITMEHIQHGDLGQHLQFQRILPEKEANIIIRQLVEGLGHMHTNRFVHRDLKPANILIVEKGPNWLVQISDFGISRKLDEGRSIGTAQQGTFGYIAPEVMGFHEERGFPFAADMWSLGAVLFRMLSGHAFLIYGHEHREFVNGDRLIPVNELKEVGVSDEGLEFLQKLLLVNPRDRLTVDEAHKHDWMK
ncbi:Serine/threonine-protein kinase RAD53, partial [Podospora fimiseda]